MSVWAHWTVFCDLCSAWSNETVGDTNREARDNARRAGWLVTQRTQLCPTCRKKAAGDQP